MTKMKQVLKNHVAIVIDRSGSMHYLLKTVVEVFNSQIETLRQSSLDFDQETRVSVYQFDYEVDNLIFDVDVARPMSIKDINERRGRTALMDGTALALDDFTELSQKYGDHSFVVYLLTDGMENESTIRRSAFKRKLQNLPDNVSVVAFAPNNQSVRELQNLGFPAGNIDLWSTDKKGVEEVGKRFKASLNSYMTQRSAGVRSTSSMFSDLSKATVADVQAVAQEVSNFEVISNSATKDVHIKPLVEKQIKRFTYTKGCAFYELVKNETVQGSKEVAVQNKLSGKVYKGKEARAILNLPNEATKVTPQHNTKWDVYVQSLSVNRNVIPKQRVLVIK